MLFSRSNPRPRPLPSVLVTRQRFRLIEHPGLVLDLVLVIFSVCPEPTSRVTVSLQVNNDGRTRSSRRYQYRPLETTPTGHPNPN